MEQVTPNTDQRVELQQQIEKQLEKYPVALEPLHIAEILNVSRRYVDQLIDEGKLEHFVLDPTRQYKQKRVLKANLIAFMINQTNNK